ncbi:MAG: glutamine synthetase III [Waddliaceae bacterium]
MISRFNAVEVVEKRKPPINSTNSLLGAYSQDFSKHVFNRTVMQKMLPREIYTNVINAMDGKEKIREEFADPVAVAMKEWAISHGATHFTHWFQPLTGASAEKHDAFIEWVSPDQMIEQFTGKQLIQGEPDASSFPSGGLRSTYEARGYTGWDPTSPAFVWKEGDGITLCIPSVFFSWMGDVLDSKIPLHRSERKLSQAVMRLLHVTGIKADRVYTTIGLEQEYFVIDRALRNLRPDLLLAGKTVFGAPSPKGQELQDHYFGSVKGRILCFMNDFERAALRLGIPVKTRHNEVAPAQHEVAPVVERATTAIDHNIQLMELMRKVAIRHNLAVLLHEKPFENLNGSGKHCNWSLATDTGINLLDPTDTSENNMHFLILLTAILDAVYEHAALLRASIGSASNDCRLGGHEAPPAIISVYLGDAIENVLDNIEKHGFHKSSSKKSKYDLGILELPDLTRDYTDRNRTSPFAFTGNKFEFRAVGSQANPAMPITVLNATVAMSLNKILDEIEKNLQGKKYKTTDTFIEAAVPVIRKKLRGSKDIRFSGDNYSADWVQEAKRRKLPNIEKSIYAYKTFIDSKTFEAFQGILNPGELQSRYEILTEHYTHLLNIETNMMIDLFKTNVLPVAMKQQKMMAKSIASCEPLMQKSTALKEQKSQLRELSKAIETAISICKELEEAQKHAASFSLIAKAEFFCDTVIPIMKRLREVVDFIETTVDDALWPLPKYRELLFLV